MDTTGQDTLSPRHLVRISNRMCRNKTRLERKFKQQGLGVRVPYLTVCSSSLIMAKNPNCASEEEEEEMKEES